MKKARGIIMALLFSALVGQPCFAILKAGDKLIPFSLKGIDGKTATVILEDGRLTLLSSSPDGSGAETRRSHPAAILIDFWATWCVPCRASMPYMQKFYDTYKPKGDQAEGGLELFGIALDAKGSAIVKPFYKKLKFNYPMLADPGPESGAAGIILNTKDMATRYQAVEIPVVYIIDSGGTIVHAHLGFKKEHVAEIEKAILECLGPEKK